MWRLFFCLIRKAEINIFDVKEIVFLVIFIAIFGTPFVLAILKGKKQ